MSESLEVTIRRKGLIGILETKGYINNIGAEKISDACDEVLDNGVRSFVLNLGNSRIINSIGISILIEVIEKVKAQDGKVAFCSVTSTIAKTFRIMGLLNASTIHDNEAEAITELS